jgi:glutathione S-transferase
VRAELARHAAAVLEGAAAMEARWLSARGGGFLASEHAPTIADIVVICDLETVSPRPAPPRPSPRSCAAGTAYTPRGTKVEFFAPDFSHLPALERWRARMRGRPAFAAVSHDLWVTTRGLLAAAPREATRAEPPRRCAQELPRER